MITKQLRKKKIMFFTILVLAAALTLESLGSYISVVGLSSKASQIIIFLAITLDFSKIMIATVLYKKWKDIHLLMRAFLIPALLFLMIVTSSGTYAFLIQEFSKTTSGQEQLVTQIELLKTEKNKLELRKKAIDDQVSQLPSSSVLQRTRLTKLFSSESDTINKRINNLDQQIPKATLQAMESSTQSGTLGSIAKAYGTTAEQISKLIAFLIVLVVDPLAIVLLTVANFLMEQIKKEKKALLLQKINDETPLDDISLMQQFKNNVTNAKILFSKQKLNESQTLTKSKNDFVKKTIMHSEKKTIKPIDFILSTHVVENPKIFIPIKYSSHLVRAKIHEYFTNCTPTIFKKLPEKSFHYLENIQIINKVDVVLPQLVVEPLQKNETIFAETANIINHIPQTTTVSPLKNTVLSEPRKSLIDIIPVITQKKSLEKNISVPLPTSLTLGTLQFIKKIEKPVPKTNMKVEEKNAGFFEDTHITRFIPSNFEENLFSEYDTKEDFIEEEHSINNMGSNNLNNKFDLNTDHCGGFKITEVLKENIDF